MSVMTGRFRPHHHGELRNELLDAARSARISCRPADHPPVASLAPPETSAAGRLVALDQLRGYVVVLVVLHHSVLAYCTFGHVNRLHYELSTAPIVDGQHWRALDVVVLLNDGFFMPLLFLLSGLFVRDALVRKGAKAFLSGRLLRLGLPFAVAELTLVPLAYYPSFLQAGGVGGFAEFWATTITTGPWPSGPPWFIGVLLIFDTVAALMTGLMRKPGRLCLSPGRCLAVLLAGSALVYLPMLLLVGPWRWFSFGPLAIQGSRVGLYAAYFAAGVALGATGMHGIIRFGEALARQWKEWGLLVILTGAAFVVFGALRAVFLSNLPRWSVLGLYGIVLVTYCGVACSGLAALFLRFGGRERRPWNSLALNSFAIYLMHYPIVTWVQYGLLSVPGSAAVKALTTFAASLAASWAGAALLRRIPGVGRVV